MPRAWPTTWSWETPWYRHLRLRFLSMLGRATPSSSSAYARVKPPSTEICWWCWNCCGCRRPAPGAAPGAGGGACITGDNVEQVAADIRATPPAPPCSARAAAPPPPGPAPRGGRRTSPPQGKTGPRRPGRGARRPRRADRPRSRPRPAEARAARRASRRTRRRRSRRACFARSADGAALSAADPRPRPRSDRQLDGDTRREVRAVREARRVAARRVDVRARVHVVEHRLDEADVVRRPGSAGRIVEDGAARRPRARLHVRVDLARKRVVVPLGRAASRVEHLVLEAGREDHHEPDLLRLLPPARDLEELHRVAAAAVEHEDEGQRVVRVEARVLGNVDDVLPREAVDGDHAAVDAAHERRAGQPFRVALTPGEAVLDLAGVARQRRRGRRRRAAKRGRARPTRADDAGRRWPMRATGCCAQRSPRGWKVGFGTSWRELLQLLRRDRPLLRRDLPGPVERDSSDSGIVARRSRDG